MRPYNKIELLDKLERLSIEREGDTIITRFNDRVIKTAHVTELYEVFDIKSYIKEKLDLIEKSFPIHEYSLTIKGGVQYLKLASESVEIGDMTFKKSFYITNSSDKSRKLSFNVGLYSDKSNIHYINSYKELDFCRRHLRGINKKVEKVFKNIDREIFDEQIESLRSLIGHEIRLSNIKKVIMGTKEKKTKADVHRFLMFKKACVDYYGNMFKLEGEERYEMWRKTTDIKTDFYLDAFNVLLTYVKCFNNQDSVILKRESKRILELTKFTIRKNVIKNILSQR